MNRGHGIRVLWNLEDLLVNGNHNLVTRHSFTAYYSHTFLISFIADVVLWHLVSLCLCMCAFAY